MSSKRSTAAIAVIGTIVSASLFHSAHGQCPFGCLEDIKWLCESDGFYGFAGVGIAYDLNDPATNAVEQATGSVTMEEVWRADSCTCQSQGCQIPCVTANNPYAISDDPSYYAHVCKEP